MEKIGPPAIQAKENVRKVEVVEFQQLGMEGIWKIEVKDFPTFIQVDNKATTSSPTSAQGARIENEMIDTIRTL